MDDIDIWRTAQLLIKTHGAEADLAAAHRVDAMIEAGDPAGEATWKKVLAATKELQRTERKPGDAVH
jgi:hypothetical protein